MSRRKPETNYHPPTPVLLASIPKNNTKIRKNQKKEVL